MKAGLSASWLKQNCGWDSGPIPPARMTVTDNKRDRPLKTGFIPRVFLPVAAG